MAWDVRSVYHYLVCFATLLMLIFGGAQVVHHGLNLLLPREVYGPSSIDIYERTRTGPVARTGGSEVGFDSLDQAALRTLAEEERVRMERVQRRDDIRRLLQSLALVLIAAPLYLYHWHRIKSLDAPGSIGIRRTSSRSPDSPESTVDS